MTKKARDLVLEYLEGEKVSPLKFNTDIVISTAKRRPPIHRIVKAILKLTIDYKSVNANNGLLETHENKIRSSLDLWRHVIYYYPEVTIFQVMRALYKLRNEIFTHYCITVSRRVFHYPVTIDDENGDTFEPGENYNTYDEDEYGLIFDAWRKI